MPYNRVIMMGFVIGAAAAATACAAGFQSMAPTGQWYGETFLGLVPGSKQLALTYDDGPNDPHTLRLLDILATHNVHATFFMIGRYVEQRPDIARDVVRAGHVVANHSFTHPNLIFASAAETRRQLQNCDRALSDAIGEHSRFFRPPFGGRRPQSLRIARELGLDPVMWNVTGWDWDAPPADVIVRKVARQIRGGDIVLLHDGGHKQIGADRSQTVLATARLIARYQQEGKQFVTIPQMRELAVSRASLPA